MACEDGQASSLRERDEETSLYEDLLSRGPLFRRPRLIGRPGSNTSTASGDAGESRDTGAFTHEYLRNFAGDPESARADTSTDTAGSSASDRDSSSSTRRQNLESSLESLFDDYPLGSLDIHSILSLSSRSLRDTPPRSSESFSATYPSPLSRDSGFTDGPILPGSSSRSSAHVSSTSRQQHLLSSSTSSAPYSSRGHDALSRMLERPRRRRGSRAVFPAHHYSAPSVSSATAVSTGSLETDLFPPYHAANFLDYDSPLSMELFEDSHAATMHSDHSSSTRSRSIFEDLAEYERQTPFLSLALRDAAAHAEAFGCDGEEDSEEVGLV
ncbi:uncharacterized protein V1518DRAFT_423456 [Limtongia smithiae]|uniref:uncharacterized protein n=1 Tax=Limtongia smithiae TaxID=1125753 RepID=UPI0034CD2036